MPWPNSKDNRKLSFEVRQVNNNKEMNNNSNKEDIQNPKVPLYNLGYNHILEDYRSEKNLHVFDVGRVILEHKDRYVIKSQNGDFEGEIIGNLRYTAQSRMDFPAVGDWVAISEYDEQKVLIHAVFPRKSIIKRKAVGKHSDEQIIATNIDFAFIVQAADRDFNLNRMERYLAICHDSKVQPIIVISKIDLIDEMQLRTILDAVKNRVKGLDVIPISNQTQTGLNLIRERISSGKSYCVLGSSGVGKSSLINSIIGESYMETKAIGEKTNRGKHVTSHRELIVLDNGGIIVDTPGMREVGISDMSEGLALTFDQITALAEDCKYNDCTHIHEKGCAVLQAIDDGQIENAMYENYLKLIREEKHYTATVAEKRKRDKKMGKLYKSIQQRKRREG